MNKLSVKLGTMFVCDMYSKPKVFTLAKAHYALFRQKYVPTKQSDPLAKLKGADSSTLLQSQFSLKRSNRQTMSQ